MLDMCHAGQMTDSLWRAVVHRAALPCSEQDYWSRTGPMQVRTDSRRRYHRFFLRGKGIAYTNHGELAIYVKDLSRMGIGFYSPLQMFPCDEIRLQMPDNRMLAVRITRCIRLDNNCFDCGSVFTCESATDSDRTSGVQVQ